MNIVQVKIENFRGIKKAEILMQSHSVFVGDNNTGKSSILEAIDLVLGPERLSRSPVIDEHDFYAGQYLPFNEQEISINIEVILIGLNSDQIVRFNDNFEHYNIKKNQLVTGPAVEETDSLDVVKALRVSFKGWYSEDDDDFIGKTYFASPPPEEERQLETFKTTDKRVCGFLFLRTLRTGSRALSLEKGTLLDIILRLKEIRPRMWEDVLSQLRTVKVAEDPQLSISSILDSIHTTARSFVTAEWVDKPQMFVSELTRNDLRKVLTVFVSTGAKDKNGKEYVAPFHHQGTGTINMLVLSLLVMIADLRQNVIFAMEEPEIAIPPYAQKRIISRVSSKTSQAIFTSHSPYVLEEFKPDQVLVSKKENGFLTVTQAGYPPTVRPKDYRDQFKRRYCEALLARRVLIVEGRTEYDVFPAVARNLHEYNPSSFSALEALGITVIDAQGDGEIEKVAKFFRNLGKEVFAIFDHQSDERRAAIALQAHHLFECPEKTIEQCIINETAESALRRFCASLLAQNEWPSFLQHRLPIPEMPFDNLKSVIYEYLAHNKTKGTMANLLAQANENEIPNFIIATLKSIKKEVEKEENEILPNLNVGSAEISPMRSESEM